MTDTNKHNIEAPKGQPCTWKDCNESQASRSWLNRDKKPWCHLCEKHHEELEKLIDKAIEEGGQKNIKQMMGAWIKASGGAQNMINTGK